VKVTLLCSTVKALNLKESAVRVPTILKWCWNSADASTGGWHRHHFWRRRLLRVVVAVMAIAPADAALGSPRMVFQAAK